jgi:L-serine dehydratase
MGPERACLYIKELCPDADSYKVILYCSLALTGKGHCTDKAIIETLAPAPVEIIFDTETPEKELPHANTLDIIAYKGGNEIARRRIMSVGGGDIRVEGVPEIEKPEIYAEKGFAEISAICKSENIRLCDYVFRHEDEGIRDFLYGVWRTMKEEINAGLTTTGTLPGGLGVTRVAQLLYNRGHIDERPETRENRMVCAYAFAAAEQNAAGERIVTAPTCGACAVVPSVLVYMQEKKSFSDEKMIRALATGGLIGNIVKQNASISGAECGCQAEIGTACSMASAALCELFDMGIDQIEYAAEMALEHHLGLTCDPVCGLVQIPCIERNAVAAMRAINALSLANFLTGTRMISFDTVVRTMYETGKDLGHQYRETSTGGLAKFF